MKISQHRLLPPPSAHHFHHLLFQQHQKKTTTPKLNLMMTTISILNNSPDLPLFFRNSNPSISTATDLTKSDTRLVSGEVRVKLSRKMKKSAAGEGLWWICVAAVAVEEHAKGRRRAVEEHAEDAWRIYVATVVAEEHTEGLAAAEMDDGAGHMQYLHM